MLTWNGYALAVLAAVLLLAVVFRRRAIGAWKLWRRDVCPRCESDAKNCCPICTPYRPPFTPGARRAIWQRYVHWLRSL